MRATISFWLPEHEQEHKDALNGTRWRCLVAELDAYLRSVEKHGQDQLEAAYAAKIRSKIWEEINANGLILHE